LLAVAAAVICWLVAAGRRDLPEGERGLEWQRLDEVPQPVPAAQPGVVALGQSVGHEHAGLFGRRFCERRGPRPALVQMSQHGQRQPDTIQLDAVLNYHSLLDLGHDRRRLSRMSGTPIGCAG